MHKMQVEDISSLIDIEGSAPNVHQQVDTDILIGLNNEANEEASTNSSREEATLLDKLTTLRYWVLLITIAIGLYMLFVGLICLRCSYYVPPLKPHHIKNLKSITELVAKKYLQYVHSPD